MINEIKHLTSIEGNDVLHVEKTSDIPEISTGENILVDHEADVVACKMMTKPLSKGGYGCQFTVLIRLAKTMLEYLNNKFPCEENTETLKCLDDALKWQAKRTANRITRGVEGKDAL